jgi:hypothetical protein
VGNAPVFQSNGQGFNPGLEDERKNEVAKPGFLHWGL